MVEGWMGSERHRDAILTPEFTPHGDSGGLWVVAKPRARMRRGRRRYFV